MKTPMQEMLEYVQDEVQLFGSARQILISKIKQLLKKEKETMVDFAYKFGDEPLSEIPKWYDKQFNIK